MNFYSKSFAFTALGVASMLVASCSQDVIGELNPDDVYDGPVVYVSAGISLPTAGTRSQTDEGTGTGDDLTNSDGKSSGEEAGKDHEYGYEYENDVRSMILLFATNEAAPKYITHTVVSGITKAPTGVDSKFYFTVTGAIKHSDLQNAYEGGVLADNQTVKVYAYCNYTQDIFEGLKDLEMGDTDWIDLEGEVIEAGSPVGHTPAITNTIWAKRSFLMTNAEEATYEFPASLEAWDPYADSNNPYQLTDNPVVASGSTPATTPIKVERTAARIDFRDGSGNTDSPNTYNLMVKKSQDESEATHNIYSVELTRMALVNMSKHYYVLRRTAEKVDDTKANTTAPFTVLGKETPRNYVADTDWEAKEANTADDKAMTFANIEKNFNFACFNEDGTYNTTGWYADKISKVLEGDEDTWGNATYKYHIWRYVTENTLPSVKSQKNAQSTGIVFRGTLRPGNEIGLKYTNKDTKTQERYVSEAVEEALKNAKDGKPEDKDWTYPVLYMFQNILYASVDDVVAYAVLEGEGSPLYKSLDNIFSAWTLSGNVYTHGGEGTEKLTVAAYNDLLKSLAEDYDGDPITYDIDFRKDTTGDAAEAFRAAAPDYGYTIYRATNEDDEGWGYYCYYFYWNRHNDNLKDGKMGPMEFATVRNNVYKLAVTGIGQLGHPRFPKDDPEPPTPDTDDEIETNYIRVQVDVLPWVVRVNNITF